MEYMKTHEKEHNGTTLPFNAQLIKVVVTANVALKEFLDANSVIIQFSFTMRKKRIHRQSNRAIVAHNHQRLLGERKQTIRPHTETVIDTYRVSSIWKTISGWRMNTFVFPQEYSSFGILDACGRGRNSTPTCELDTHLMQRVELRTKLKIFL